MTINGYTPYKKETFIDFLDQDQFKFSNIVSKEKFVGPAKRTILKELKLIND